MKIFPTKHFKFTLNGNNPQKYIELLKSKTLESNSLSTKSTNKEFIGRINGSYFEIIGSEIGIGAFMVLRGNFLNDAINIVAEINPPFKKLISVLFILVIASIAYNGFIIGFPAALGMLIPLMIFIGFVRFVFLRLFFNKAFNLIFNKFSTLLNLNQTCI